MPILKTKTTYLEMRTTPRQQVSAPRDDILVQRVDQPDIEEYRQWYRSIGDELYWVDRLQLSDEALREIIHDPRVDVAILLVGGQKAGFSELDRRVDNEVEVAYFGLYPAYIGQGLGKFFLDWTLRAAWEYDPARVWLHTCDLDHQAALPNYLKAGLEIYDETIVDQFVPDEMT